MNGVRQNIDAARQRGETVLSEFDSKRILGAYGIPVTRESLVADANAAVTAATKIGFPVVVKGCAAGLAHKTELDLVAVGLADATAVHDAASRLLPRLPAGARILVQEMVPGRRELMLGLSSGFAVRALRQSRCRRHLRGSAGGYLFSDCAFRPR